MAEAVATGAPLPSEAGPGGSNGTASVSTPALCSCCCCLMRTAWSSRLVAAEASADAAAASAALLAWEAARAEA